MNVTRGVALQKVDTVLNADAVEWCPYVGHQEVLLCGTYKLLETPPADLILDQDSALTQRESKIEAQTAESAVISPGTPQVRVGGVTTYKIQFSENGKPYLQECSKVSMCGVLDIKWLETVVGGKLVYGVVNAEGQFQIFQLQEENHASTFVAASKLSDSSLGLSLGWTGHSEGKPMITASDSAGCISVFQIDENISPISSWKAHDYEAWITAFHNFNSNLVYSGGDDCKLKGWDLRDLSQPTFCSKSHQMGVCSVQSHPFNEYLFASGSYDEMLSVWDCRKLKQPLTGASLGGGVWRIKWHPFSGSRILTATMYNGAHIIECSDLGQSSLPIVAQYDDHNLAYGADWCRLSPYGTSVDTTEAREGCGKDSDESRKQDSFLISTCSFYDHSLHLWEWSAQIKL